MWIEAECFFPKKKKEKKDLRAPMKPPQRADTEFHHQGSPQGQEPLPHEQARQVCWSRGYYSWVGCSSTSPLKRQGALGQQGPQSKV